MDPSENSQTLLTPERILAIPFLETVSVLRGVIEEIGARLMSPSPASQADSLRPALPQLLERQPVAAIWQKNAAHPDSREGQQKRGEILQEKDALKDLAVFNQAIRQYLDGKTDLNLFYQSITRRELSSLTLAGYDLLPKIYWPLAAQAAWRNPEFQLRFGYLVWSYLRCACLFTPDEVSAPTFSPQTFWALILLLDLRPNTTPSRGLDGMLNGLRESSGALKDIFQQANPKNSPAQANSELVPSPAWLGGAAKTLRATALEEAGAPGWAGFWDQWLLARAVAAWAPVPEGDTQEFYQALLDLPVMKDQIPQIVESYRSKYNWQKPPAIKLDRPFVPGEKPGWYRSPHSPTK